MSLIDQFPLLQKKGCMVDLETLGRRHGCAIVSVGAVKFSFTHGILDRFKVNISAEDCVKYGLKIEKETIDWWAQQSKESRMSWMKDPLPLKEALDLFDEWYGKDKKMMFWCQGLSFDVPTLDDGYFVLGREKPWKYWNEIDLRSIYSLIGANNQEMRENDKNSVHHDALADAEAQAKGVISLFT